MFSCFVHGIILKKETKLSSDGVTTYRGIVTRWIFTLTLLALLGLAGCGAIPQAGLKALTPAEAGLTWQECPVTRGSIDQGFDLAEAQTCFGQSLPLWNEAEKANFATRVGMEALRLEIGSDVYETRLASDTFPIEKYTLFKNGVSLQSLSGQFTAFSPNIALQNIGGKAAWEFSDGNTATILYDGVDLRALYGLDRAYRPYGLDGKLIFVGEKEGQFFVVYAGNQVGAAFDRILIAYCCEPAMWSVQYGSGKYLFWGLRGEQWLMVGLMLEQ